MTVLGIAFGLALALTPAAAQGQQPGDAAANLTLVYEREVYTYDAQGRRNPFRPLSTDDEMGPQFEMLELQGIIYQTGRGQSLALLKDVEGRIYRVRAGDRIGNSRVIEIGPLRVVMAVENFGSVRQEMLELPSRGGTER